MPSVLYFVWVRVGANSVSFYTRAIKYIEYGNEKNEYQSLMNIFAQLKDIESECTQDRIRNKLCLFIIYQFHFYYHQCDHCIQRSIERVVMHFFQNVHICQS